MKNASPDTPAVPLPYLPSYEKLEDDEAQTAQELAESMLHISQTVAENEGRALRSVHAKAHGISRGTLQVPSERFDPDDGFQEQDFLMVNAHVFGVPNAKKLLSGLKVVAATTERAPRAKKLLSMALRGGVRKQRGMQHKPRARTKSSVSAHGAGWRPTDRLAPSCACGVWLMPCLQRLASDSMRSGGLRTGLVF